MTTKALPSGQLRANLDIPSWRLNENLPIEVRDSRLNLVGQLKHNESMSLKPGWYEVSAILDDGQRHAETVQVKAGAKRDVTLTIDASQLEMESMPSAHPDADAIDVELLGVEQAKVDEQTPSYWTFLPDGRHPKSVPVAHLCTGYEELDVSLPVNPRGGYGPHATCVMTFTRHERGVRVRAGFHPDRIVSSAIHNMIEKRQFAQATKAAEVTAEDMLQSKYQDPVGAALGGMILYRAGTLMRRKSWVDNLQRDFDWMPDGKILLAALTGRDDVELSADLLVRASQQRPLFTECFSILFDLLRRWPSKHRAKEIGEALAKVARQARRVDWTAFTFTDRPS